MECWQCGVEPESVHETTTFSDPEPTYVAGRWPAGDHEHAVSPPSPEELERVAYEAFLERYRML